MSSPVVFSLLFNLSIEIFLFILVTTFLFLEALFGSFLEFSRSRFSYSPICCHGFHTFIISLINFGVLRHSIISNSYLANSSTCWICWFSFMVVGFLIWYIIFHCELILIRGRSVVGWPMGPGWETIPPEQLSIYFHLSPRDFNNLGLVFKLIGAPIIKDCTFVTHTYMQYKPRISVSLGDFLSYLWFQADNKLPFHLSGQFAAFFYTSFQRWQSFSRLWTVCRWHIWNPLSPGQGYIMSLVWALNLPSPLQLPGLIWTWDPNTQSSWQLPCHQLLLSLWFWFPPPLGYLGFPILFQQLFVVLSQHFTCM